MPWIPSLHSDYHLGIDGIALPLILLTTFSTILVIIAGLAVLATEYVWAQRMLNFAKAKATKPSSFTLIPKLTSASTARL